MTPLRLVLWALVIVLSPVPSAFAADAGAIKVDSAWARAPLTPHGAAAAFITLENTGTTADRLIGVKSGDAKRAMLHTSMVEHGIAKMNHVKGFDLAPGATLAMGPGGNHVMLMGVSPEVKQGGHFPLTLVFEKAGEVTVDVEVLSGRAMGPKPMPEHHMAKKPHGQIHGGMIDEVPANLDTATTKLSAHKRFRVSMIHDHPIAINRMHGCILRVTTPDGKPVENASITLDGGMPAHGHGLPTAPRVTRYLGDGKYRVEGMKFGMAGWWQLTFDIGGEDADTVTFNLVLQ